MSVVTWRAAAFLALEMDAAWGGRSRLLGRAGGRLRRSMGDDEIVASEAVLRAVPAAVAAWGEGVAELEMRSIQRIEEPIRRLTAIGDGRWWVSPDDLPSSVLRRFQSASVDAIFVLWPTDGAVPLCGWGCTIGPGPGTGGAGYSSIISDGWAGYPDRLHPEEGFVHEWLHQVESVLRGRGVGPDVLPNLHDVDRRTSCRSTNLAPYGRTYPEHHAATDTWQPWYRDLMTGTVRGREGREPACLGLRPEDWSISRP